MTRRDINRQINEILAERRAAAEEDARARFRAAMEDADFKAAELAARSAEMELAKASAFQVDTPQMRTRTAALQRKRDELAAVRGYDLAAHYRCPICNDTGYRDGKHCICRQKLYDRLLREKCGMAHLPEFVFSDDRFDRLPVDQAGPMRALYELMRRFCDNFDRTPVRTILVTGGVGVGKSCLACATAAELMGKGYAVLYLSAFDFGNVLLARHLGKRDERAMTFDDVLDCDFLVIDDLGTEPIYRNVTLEYLFSVIDSRVTAGKKTMIVSNLDAERFLNRYGERTFSRIVNKRYAIAPRYISGQDLRNLRP